MVTLTVEAEQLIGITSQGIPIFVAHNAADVSDLSALEEVRRIEAEIMRLPPEARNEAWISLSPILASFSQSEASFRALEELYTRDGVRFNGLVGTDDHGVAKAWFNCFSNARAVRERGTLTTRQLLSEINNRTNGDELTRVEILSIASGSARCVLEALRQSPHQNVHARMLDWDPEAREYSEKLACELGVRDKIETVAGDVIRISRNLTDLPVNIVEAVGILDYLENRVCLFLLKQIYRFLQPTGVILASNIMPNNESEFIHTAVGWRPMFYRTEESFVALLLESGFQPDQCRIYRIPQSIYCLVVARK